jgi:hypothetical protein
MKQEESDLLAKIIRNLNISPGLKEEIVTEVCKRFFEHDQFFNVKRFRNLANLNLDKGWPDEVNREWCNDNPGRFEGWPVR